MIRGKIPSLISGSSGKPKIVFALRSCKCKRCNKPISQNGKCIDIPKIGGSYSSNKRYCLTCFFEILSQSEKDLNVIKNEALG